MDCDVAPDLDRAIIEAHAGAKAGLIVESFRRVTGGELVRPYGETLSQLWNAPTVVVAHGTEPDPIFFYGNRAALDLFGMAAQEFIQLPSRLSAEPDARGERSRLLAEVSEKNFISDYSGIRIAKSGHRFVIERAIVWNLLALDGSVHGQAACFEHWRLLGQP
jgi:hypothetical protein